MDKEKDEEIKKIYDTPPDGTGGNESLKKLLKRTFSLTKDVATHEEIQFRLLSNGTITGTNMLVMICAIVIASIGLNTGSTAVIIGAMLISPIMSTILASAFCVISADFWRVRRYLLGLTMQIVISVGASTIFFLISPVKAPTAELIARTSPSVFDILIATFGGLAGIIGQTRAEKSNNIIPGVAIATALMPPLCTCGYSIANANWRMLAGASYLFLINAYFIFLSAAVILAVLRIPKVQNLTEAQWRRMRRIIAIITCITIIPAIFFITSMATGT